MGRDSDDELALGEVGKCGVAVDTLADVEDLYRGIDLGAVTTSMTINGPAAVIFAMYVANAEATGVERARLGGTLQNDILKEYQAQKEFIFPPRPSLRLVADTMRFCTAEMPRWHPLSISGYHIREAGSTAAEELAFTVANGFAYVELGIAGRARRRRVRAALVVLLQRAHRLLRGDRQVPRRAPHLGPLDARPLRRAARALAADAVPHADRGRVAHRAAARGQHRAHRDRGAGRRARRHAEPAHQLDGRDAGAADRAGGPHRAAHAAGDRARDAGRQRRRPARRLVVRRGAHRRDGAPGRGDLRPHRRAGRRARCSTARCAASRRAGSSRQIADSAYELERKLNAGRHVVVGVNAFLEGNDEPPPETLRIGPEVEEEQRRRLEKVRDERDAGAVERALARVRADAAEPTVNLMPALLDAVRAYATLGEIVDALADVFGRWVEQPRI